MSQLTNSKNGHLCSTVFNMAYGEASRIGSQASEEAPAFVLAAVVEAGTYSGGQSHDAEAEAAMVLVRVEPPRDQTD